MEGNIDIYNSITFDVPIRESTSVISTYFFDFFILHGNVDLIKIFSVMTND
jgi:hypothetical protein